MSKTNTEHQGAGQNGIVRDRRTVLVMENEKELAEVYKSWLNDDYEVRVAYDGDEAIELYDEEVDVVLLDRTPSGASAHGVLRDIRELPGDCMAAMIASVEPEDDTSTELEAYIRKPADEESMRVVTENLMVLSDYDERGRSSFEPEVEKPEFALDALAHTANQKDVTAEELLQGFIDTITAVCTPALVSTWTFDEDDALELREYVGKVDEELATVVLDDELIEDIVWRTYSGDVTQKTYSEDELAEADTGSHSLPLKRCMAYRLGNHGVALVFLEEPSLDGSEMALMRSAATVVGRSLENQGNMRKLEEERQRSDEHEQLNAEMKEVDRLVRRTREELLSSTTRGEIEQTLCRQLTQCRFIKFAWIGEYLESGDKLTVKHSTDRKYMETLLDNGEKEAAKQVVLEEETEFTKTLNCSPPLEPWKEKALKQGFNSVIRTPLRQDSSVEGVLTVYLDEKPRDFTYLSNALEDLGSAVGCAIKNYEAKASLALNKLTEIKSRVTDPTFPHVRLASRADTNVVLEGVAYSDEEGYKQYLSFESHDDRDTKEAVYEAVESLPAIESCEHVASRREREAFHVTGDLFLREIIHMGGRPSSLVATSKEAEVTVHAPKLVSTSSFISLLEQEYDSVDLLSKNDIDRGFEIFSEVEEIVHSELTETELETIKTAYYGGYFASPREKTGKDLGEELGVTQPTVTENIKSAEKKLLRLLFDDGGIDVNDSAE